MKERIEQYFCQAKPYTRTELAYALDIHPKKLDRILRSLYNRTFRELRVHYIQKIMKEEQLSISEATDRFGFSKTQNLSRLLKRFQRPLR